MIWASALWYLTLFYALLTISINLAQKPSFETFQLFSSSDKSGLGFFDSAETSLPPPPPCVEVLSSEVLYYYYYYCHQFTNLTKFRGSIEIFFSSFEIDIVFCEVHCGACKLGGTYFAQGNFSLSLCLVAERMKEKKREKYDKKRRKQWTFYAYVRVYMFCGFDFWKRENFQCYLHFSFGFQNQ